MHYDTEQQALAAEVLNYAAEINKMFALPAAGIWQPAKTYDKSRHSYLIGALNATMDCYLLHVVGPAALDFGDDDTGRFNTIMEHAREFAVSYAISKRDQRIVGDSILLAVVDSFVHLTKGIYPAEACKNWPRASAKADIYIDARVAS